MNIKIFNACLLAGWFLITLGGVLWNPAAGLIIAGVALIALTVFSALQWGVFEKPKEDGKKSSGAA